MDAKHWTLNGETVEFHDYERDKFMTKDAEGHFTLDLLPNTYVNHLMIGTSTLQQFILSHK